MIQNAFLSGLSFALSTLAVVIMIRVAWAVVLFTMKYLYEIQRRVEYSTDARLSLFTQENPTRFYDIYNSVKKITNKKHSEAISAQQVYLYHLTACATCTLVAIFAMFSSILTSDTKSIAYYFVTIEFVALLLLILFFFRGLESNRYWISKRTEAETARSSRATLPLFVDRKMPSAEFQTFFADFIETMHMKMASTAKSHGFVSATEDFAQDLKEKAETFQTNATSSDFRAYVVERIFAQLKWFDGARIRLNAANYIREYAITSLFFLTLALAFVKFAYYSSPSGTDFISIELVGLGLALCASITAAISYFISGRGNRTLLQRYKHQNRELNKILDEIFDDQSLYQTQDSGLDEASAAHKRKSIIFKAEKLMLDEHSDWISIIETQKIELG